ncbi:hypothetical protein TPR58_19025 [Sphingomonas sp. HF-S3]|uniref:Uncharacterized protein n=1 Tax=Sphingomonas rustica TaxID=3103142 RepID=A0ABV0BCM6_9SPHN
MIGFDSETARNLPLKPPARITGSIGTGPETWNDLGLALQSARDATIFHETGVDIRRHDEAFVTRGMAANNFMNRAPRGVRFGIVDYPLDQRACAVANADHCHPDTIHVRHFLHPT